MKTYFLDDRYATSPVAPVSFLNRILGGWRWVFYAQYVVGVLRARKMAVRGLYDDSAWAESSFGVLRTIERNRGRFEITGIDRVRSAAGQGPLIFISNHMSTLETQVLPALIAPFMPVTFVVKERLATSPVFGPIMRSRDPITVGRKNPREDLEAVLRGGVERLQRGVSIIVFPQSTRSPVFNPEAFNTLGIKLASEAGVPVMPIAVKTDFWGDEGLFRGFGPIRPERTIHIEFGSLLKVAGRGKDQHLEIVKFIESRLSRWGAHEREARGAPQHHMSV
ncbi:MAG: 1-acyl-sn-glycerol-3-phosphate acyltransferase [Spirochaetes bacterium]|nr:1-acyl-sn-glycerol-3-phosphate acyltransferase [Spirochaetota bacterium]